MAFACRAEHRLGYFRSSCFRGGQKRSSPWVRNLIENEVASLPSHYSSPVRSWPLVISAVPFQTTLPALKWDPALHYPGIMQYNSTI